MERQANIKFCCRLWKTDDAQDSDKQWVGWSRVQTPVGVARSSTPIQTSSKANPASCIKITGAFSLGRGVKWLWHGLNRPPPPSMEVGEWV